MCSGSRVTIQCTLTGNTLVWNKVDGDINLVRGLHTSSSSGSYQWQLQELEGGGLRSLITFVVAYEFTITCIDNEGDFSSVTIVIEGTRDFESSTT